MRVQNPALREERMHKRIAKRALGNLAKLGPRHHQRVDVHAVRIESRGASLGLFVIDRHEHQVDIGLIPNPVVRQAAAEDGGQYGAILFYLVDEAIDGLRKPPLHGVSRHTFRSAHIEQITWSLASRGGRRTATRTPRRSRRFVPPPRRDTRRPHNPEASRPASPNPLPRARPLFLKPVLTR